MRKFRDIINLTESRYKSFSEFILNEAISYSYNIPQDREKQLYDFYTWSLWYQTGLKNKFKVPEGTLLDLESILQESIIKITNQQKKELLSAVLTSIISETDYMFEPNIDEEFQKSLEQHNSLQSYKKYIQIKMHEKPDKVNKKYMASKDKFTNQSIRSFIKSKWNYKDFVNVAKDLFDSQGKREKVVGGDAWAQICDGWLQLYDANDVDEKIQAIDHIYDLEHNNGTVLSKVAAFAKKGKQGDYGWIKEALDFKFSAPPWKIVSRSSIPSRIAGYFNRVTGVDTTKQEYENITKPQFDNYQKNKEDKEKNNFIQKYSKPPITKNKIANMVSDITHVYGKRIPELEPLILKNPYYSYIYAKDVIKGRWPEAEPFIMKKDPIIAALYANDVIKGRWPEAEPFIMNNNYAADEYEFKN